MSTPTQLTFLRDGGGSFQLNEDDFVIFMDETGDEFFSDPNYPVFGLGACCCLGKYYLANIRDCWQEMKAKRYRGSTRPLHASKLRGRKTKVRRAINSFFRKNEFHRIAIVLTDKTCFSDAPNFKAHQVAALWMHRYFGAVACDLDVGRVLLMAEDSARLNTATQQYFSSDCIVCDGGREIPLLKYFMPKEANEPGLEVADFIAYSSGKQVQSGFLGKESELIREDFESIFRSSDSKYSHFLKIEKVRSD